MPRAAEHADSPMTDVKRQRRAEFRTFLAIEGSVSEAGRLFYRSTNDAAAACREMLNEHLTVSFAGTQAALDLEFSGEQADDYRKSTRIALTLQRAGIIMRRNRRLQALVDRDDVLQLEISRDEEALATKELTPAEREEITARIKMNRICRTDLATLAQVLLEQAAIRERVESEGISVFDDAEFEELARVADERVAHLIPALNMGAPLRRALAADLATEPIVAPQPQPAVLLTQTAEAPRKGLVR